MKKNYNNKSICPLKKGKIEDVVKPRRPRIQRIQRSSTKEEIDDLYIDLVQVLSAQGIILSNVWTLAAKLIKLGWVKHQKPIRE